MSTVPQLPSVVDVQKRCLIYAMPYCRLPGKVVVFHTTQMGDPSEPPLISPQPIPHHRRTIRVPDPDATKPIIPLSLKSRRHLFTLGCEIPNLPASARCETVIGWPT